MLRISVLAFALLSTPALAQAPHYAAQPVAAPAQQRLAMRDTAWRCDGAVCTSGRSNTRHALVCSRLARELGALRSFAVQGIEFTAEELENCNRRAR